LAQEYVKPKHRLNSDAIAILSYLRPASPIPSGKIERELRKMKGVKEITINPLTYTVKIRYDPNVVSVEKMRLVLKRLAAL